MQGIIDTAFKPCIYGRITAWAALSLLGLCVSLPAIAANEQPPEDIVPVTTLTLKETAFDHTARLTGSVGLYREEKVGFEVSGRMLFVLDLGREVEGPARDESGKDVKRGDVIARLDDTRYRLRVKALEAKLGALNKDLQAQQIDVKQVAEASLAAARANLRISESDIVVAQRQITEAEAQVTRTRLDLERQLQLKKRNSGAFRQKALDDARAAFDAASALKEQRVALLEARRRAREAQMAAVTVAKATITFKEAQVQAALSRIAELQQELNTARRDLRDTVLRAPFNGRITEIHAAGGAVVSAGQNVVTLTLMDPIQISVEVSADAERRIRAGDRAWVHPKDPTDPERKRIDIGAAVFEKSAVADPGTRTFRIDLMARNSRRLLQHVDPSTKGMPVATDFLPLARRYLGEDGPLYAPVKSILRENGKTFVLRLPSVGFQPSASKRVIGRHVPEKIEITLGDSYLTVIKWNFRSLVNSNGLEEGDFLVVDPKPEYVTGLVFDRPQWLLRPGDLVPVRFLLNQTPKGFYVPVEAIFPSGGQNSIYLLADNKAKAIPVNVHETFQEMHRITGKNLTAGSKVIIGGAHLLSDGQLVRVVGQESNPETVRTK